MSFVLDPMNGRLLRFYRIDRGLLWRRPRTSCYHIPCVASWAFGDLMLFQMVSFHGQRRHRVCIWQTLWKSSPETKKLGTSKLDITHGCLKVYRVCSNDHWPSYETVKLISLCKKYRENINKSLFLKLTMTDASYLLTKNMGTDHCQEISVFRSVYDEFIFIFYL